MLILGMDKAGWTVLAEIFQKRTHPKADNQVGRAQSKLFKSDKVTSNSEGGPAAAQR